MENLLLDWLGLWGEYQMSDFAAHPGVFPCITKFEKKSFRDEGEI